MPKVEKPPDQEGLPSFEDIDKVVNQLDLSQSHRVLLYRFRRYMSNGKKKQSVCYPNQATLSRELNMGLRTVKRLVADLKKTGLIKVSKRGRVLNQYEFIFPWVPQMAPIEGVTSGTYKGVKNGTYMGVTSGPLELKKRELKKKEVKETSSSEVPLDDETTFFSSSKNLAEKTTNRNQAANPKEKKIPIPTKPPPPLPLEKLPKYGFDERDLLDLTNSQGFDLSRISRNFNGGSSPELNKAIPAPYGAQFEDFYTACVSQHWKGARRPEIGFKTCFVKAYWSGLLYHFGFKPLTQAEIDERDRKQQETEVSIMREQEKRMQREQAAYDKAQARHKFIRTSPWLIAYLRGQDLIEHESSTYDLYYVWEHITKVMEQHNLKSKDHLKKYCLNQTPL